MHIPYVLSVVPNRSEPGQAALVSGKFTVSISASESIQAHDRAEGLR